MNISKWSVARVGNRANKKEKNQNKKRDQDKNQNSTLENKIVKEVQSEETTLDGTKNEGTQENSEATSRNNSDRTVYSDHIFMIPLEMDAGFELSDAWKEEFVDSGFLEEGLQNNSGEIDIVKGLNDDELRKQYMLLRYFNENAQHLMINEEGSFVTNYRFTILEKMARNKKAQFVIDLGDKARNVRNKEYCLDLVKIRLRKYKCVLDESKSLYLLMIYTENRKYRSIDEIKEINQFGRRLYAPWITGGEIKRTKQDRERGIEQTECAQGLGLVIGDIRIPNMCDFAQQDLNHSSRTFEEIKEFISSKNDKKYIATFIQELLSYSEDGAKKQNVNFDLIMDDRMFVCFCINNRQLSKQLKKYCTDNQKYRYQFDEQLSDELYSIIYVDKKEATCRSITMREDLLKKAVYDRWIGLGTIHSITQNAFGCITDNTGNEVEHTVRRPFIVEYVEMFSVVLMQRVQLLRFSKKASSLSGRFNPEKKFKFWRKRRNVAKSFQKLQEQYIKFKSQMLLFEVTPQEQGYELYRKLQQEMYIFEEKDMLENQLQSLYEYANIVQDRNLNNYVLLVAILTLIATIVSVYVATRFR